MMITQLIQTKKTVFTIEDLMKIVNTSDKNYLRVLLTRMTKRKELIRIRKGIYTYTTDYDKGELANKLKRPSYVSLERVIFDQGVIFQDYSLKITSISNNNRSFYIDGITYSYNKIKDSILMNPLGVINNGNVRIATVERAICDMVYISKNYYFDNLKNVNSEKVLTISKIYNKRVKNEIKKLCST